MKLSRHPALADAEPDDPLDVADQPARRRSESALDDVAARHVWDSKTPG